MANLLDSLHCGVFVLEGSSLVVLVPLLTGCLVVVPLFVWVQLLVDDLQHCPNVSIYGEQKYCSDED